MADEKRCEALIPISSTARLSEVLKLVRSARYFSLGTDYTDVAGTYVLALSMDLRWDLDEFDPAWETAVDQLTDCPGGESTWWTYHDVGSGW